MDEFNLTNEKKITQKEWREFEAFKEKYQENESTRNLLLQNINDNLRNLLKQNQDINDTLSGGIRSANITEYRNTYVFNDWGNCDATYPFIMNFELLDNMTKLVECKVSFKIRNFNIGVKDI